MKLCIILPAFNEELSIADTILEYQSIFPKSQMVVIDNKSKDQTSDEALKVLRPNQDLLLHEDRQGKGFAVKTGLARVDADIYLMVDSDLTYPAKDALRLLDIMLSRRVDMVVGNRIFGDAYKNQNSRPGHSWGNNLLTYMISLLSGKKYQDVLSGLRVMSRPFVASLDVRSSGFQLETELNVVAAYLRANVIEAPISYRSRPDHSVSKLNTVSDGFRILSFTLRNWIAFAPMQPLIFLAVIALFISALLFYRVISGFLATGFPYTTTATIAVGFGLISLLAIFFGLTLRILSRNERRREIIRFLEMQRMWNSALDD